MDRVLIASLVLFLSLTSLAFLKSFEDNIRPGNVVFLCGTLIPVKVLEKGCVYRLLTDKGEIRAVKFSGSCSGGYTCVYGRIEVYRGERELVILGYS